MDSGRSRITPHHLLLVFWAMIAAINIGQGAINSLKPGQSQDFALVYSWLTTWLWQGASPYYLPQGLTGNYPPYAIALLSPLALIPLRAAVPLWTLVNVALAPAAALAAIKVVRPEGAIKSALLPCLLFLSWAGLRIGLGNGQFTLLMVALGVFGVLLVRKRPYLAGALLGLSLMKPHVGAAFFLWALLTKKFRTVLASLVLLLFGLLVFSIRVGQSPLTVTRDFLGVLRYQFGAGSFLPGVLELRPLVHLLVPGYGLAELAHLILLIGFLTAICAVAFKQKQGEAKGEVVILQLCCLLMLMSVFHNFYDSVLLLPLMVGLWATSAKPSDSIWRGRDQLVLWILQVALVIELPGVWWKLQQRFDVSAYQWAGWFMSNFDRVLILALFLYLTHKAWTYRAAAAGRVPAGNTLVET